MKNYLFIAFVLLTAPVIAQTYQYVPMPTSGMVWKATNTRHHRAASTCSKYEFSFTGRDSIDNGDRYYEVKVLGIRNTNDDCRYGKGFELPMTATYEKNQWMIEKNQKIYFLDSVGIDTTKHRPSMDFSVQAVGDTLYDLYGHDTVIAIDTININNTLRRRMVVQTVYGLMTDTVVEGVGSAKFALGFKELHEEGLDMMPHPMVVCISANNQLIYQYNNSACAPMWPLGIDEVLPGQEYIKAHPNPFTDIVKLTNVVNAGVTIYNMFGHKVYSSTGIKNNDFSISTASWPAGIYLFVTEQNEGTTINKLVKY